MKPTVSRAAVANQSRPYVSSRISIQSLQPKAAATRALPIISAPALEDHASTSDQTSTGGNDPARVASGSQASTSASRSLGSTSSNASSVQGYNGRDKRTRSSHGRTLDSSRNKHERAHALGPTSQSRCYDPGPGPTAKELTQQIGTCSTWPQLQQLHVSYRNRMDFIHCSAMLTKAAKVAPRLSDNHELHDLMEGGQPRQPLGQTWAMSLDDVSLLHGRFLQALVTDLKRQSRCLRAREVANAIWALGKLSPSCPALSKDHSPWLLGLLTQNGMSMLGRLKPQEASNVLYGLAVAGTNLSSIWPFKGSNSSSSAHIKHSSRSAGTEGQAMAQAWQRSITPTLAPAAAAAAVARGTQAAKVFKGTVHVAQMKDDRISSTTYTAFVASLLQQVVPLTPRLPSMQTLTHTRAPAEQHSQANACSPAAPVLQTLGWQTPSGRSDDSASPQALANVVWALARLGVPPSRDWSVCMLAACKEQFTGFTPHGLAMLVWSLAQLKIRPNAAWADALLAVTGRRIREFGPQAVTNLLHGLVDLAVRPPASWIDTVHAHMLQQAHGRVLNAQDVANCLWALAKYRNICKPPAPELINLLLDRAYGLMEGTDAPAVPNPKPSKASVPGDLSNGSDVASRGDDATRTQRRPGHAVQAHRATEGANTQQFTLQGYASMIGALAVLEHKPSAAWTERFLGAVYGRVSRMPGSLSAMSGAQMLWGLTSLGLRPAGRWLAPLYNALEPQVSSFNAEDVQQLQAALSQLKAQPQWSEALAARAPEVLPSATDTDIHSHRQMQSTAVSSSPSMVDMDE